MFTKMTPNNAGLILLCLCMCASAGAPTLSPEPVAPKKLLVVSTTGGDRHTTDIVAAEKTLARLAEQTHAFTLDFVRQPEGRQPIKPKLPVALKPDASAAEKVAFEKSGEDFKAAQAVYVEADKKFRNQLTQVLQKLSPESLKNYDGVIFCYTSGDLPLPDKEGLVAWVKAGHAFIGLTSYKMANYPSYFEMFGGKWKDFTGKATQPWTDIEVVSQDPKHPANREIPARWTYRENSQKIMNFIPADPAQIHELFIIEKSPIDQSPGHFPVAWCREYGRGRVFYTSLGSNLDLWDPELANRKNPPEVARIFNAHIFGGILWALQVDHKEP